MGWGWGSVCGGVPLSWTPRLPTPGPRYCCCCCLCRCHLVCASCWRTFKIQEIQNSRTLFSVKVAYTDQRLCKLQKTNIRGKLKKEQREHIRGRQLKKKGWYGGSSSRVRGGEEGEEEEEKVEDARSPLVLPASFHRKDVPQHDTANIPITPALLVHL